MMRSNSSSQNNIKEKKHIDAFFHYDYLFILGRWLNVNGIGSAGCRSLVPEIPTSRVQIGNPSTFWPGALAFFFLFFFFLVYNLADRPKKCAKITPFSSGICLFFPVSLFPEELGSRDNSARSKVAFLF